MPDAEVEIAPEEEESGGFDAGFEKLVDIWCCDDEAADNESSDGSDKEGPAERAQLKREPGERALKQIAADGAKGQAREEDADTHDQLVSEEAFKVGIAKLPRLADVWSDEEDGGEAKATAAYGLEQPEGGEMDLIAVKHGRHFTLSRPVDGGGSSQKGFDLPQTWGFSRNA
jgi:hypothetical protein